MKDPVCRLILAAFIVCVACGSAFAQFPIRDIQGRPVQAKVYTDVKGTPYLQQDWATGSIKLINGSELSGIELLYDQVNDELIFKGENGQMQAFAQPVLEFTIKTDNGNRTFKKGYDAVDEATLNSFFEVLADGKTQLLKRTTKTIFEERPYGSASKVKTFSTNDAYYIAKANKPVKFRRDKKSVLLAFSDKADELDKYIKVNKLNLKDDADLTKLVTYYNELN